MFCSSCVELQPTNVSEALALELILSVSSRLRNASCAEVNVSVRLLPSSVLLTYTPASVRHHNPLVRLLLTRKGTHKILKLVEL